MLMYASRIKLHGTSDRTAAMVMVAGFVGQL